MTVRELHVRMVNREVPDDGILGMRGTSPRLVADKLAAHRISATPTVLADQAVEIFGALCLDGRGIVTAVEIVSVGALAACTAQPREIFRPAIMRATAAIIVFHNHPSGDPEPSQDDIAVTVRLRAAGLLLGIDVIDHIIIGANGRYTSFRERGL